ncbi:hypothetical protein ON010_g1529 [Phytophthora cinnamomi]|nr:hypothetical protein ON010_g1529 [Phytophthora cinnamomi]
MSTEQVASESSSDSGSRIPQPICAVVTPPMVTSTSREALIAWLKLRDEYVEGTKERCKAAKEGLNAVKLLVNSLPSMLKVKVQNEIEYRSPDAQTSVLKLSKLINQKGIEKAIEDRALARTRLARQGKTRVAQNQFQDKKRPAQQQQRSDKCFKKFVPRKVEMKKDASEPPNKKVPPRQDVSIAVVRTTRRIARAQPRMTVGVLLRRSVKRQEFLLVRTTPIYDVPFCADSGADWSGMNMAVYDEFVKACPDVRVVTLEEPLTYKGADGMPIEVNMSLQLHLRLRTVARSIDVERQLDLLVANAIPNEQDDEIDDVDEPQIGSSVVLSVELRVTVDKLLEVAIEKGFPKDSVAELRRIATRFDIWRLKLGDDPPARVPQ